MRRLGLLLLILGFAGCSKQEKEAPLFELLKASQTGVDFTNTLTERKGLNILDYLYFYNGGGVAAGDINNDGLVDLYFTGNQVSNRLYLNKGNYEFEDITTSAGVGGTSDWTTGVTMADINGDGLLDLYVCAVVGVSGLQGHNELFINNGDGTFTESAAAYGLDFQNYSSSAAFFDYDNDGDLDLYLLNHAVHTVNTYGPAAIRGERTKESGDKLLRNDQGTFTDVSEEAGIFGGPNGYGLGIATADFNNDGFTDLYISNDFHEDDFYYLNDGQGGFREMGKERFGHFSRFSMGSDVADVNNDGYMDILSLDMLPEEETVLKASVGDDPLDLHRMKIERLGYHHQYTRNMLHLNRSGAYFQETGLLSGLAATDWSWSALFGDYDLDGMQDVFIATGIPRRPNDLDYIRYVSSKEIRKKINKTRLVDQEALDRMPSGKVPNYMFRGEDGTSFSDRSSQWVSRDSIISTGAAYADLDNDGALEIITNNIGAPAGIYRNKKPDTANYLKISFAYTAPNTSGIGTKVLSYHDGQQQLRQLYTSRGFQSSSEPALFFGYGETSQVDSLKIIWPDGTFQELKDISTNQHVFISPDNRRAATDPKMLFPGSRPWFEKVDSLPGLTYTHQENRYTDVDRQKLIPYQISDRGPGMVIADFNSDGRDDVFFGSSKFTPSRLFYQEEKAFRSAAIPEIAADSITEEVWAIACDVDQDGRPDLLSANGGGEFQPGNTALENRYYQNQDGKFRRRLLPGTPENSSVVKAHDYDHNGFPDLFIGNGAVPNDFGKRTDSYLLRNENGEFSVVQQDLLEKTGMVTDAIWSDFNGDGWEDLIVVGEWMQPRFFSNDQGTLQEVTGEVLDQNLSGLWQSIIPYDIDGDGKEDYLLGNWGLNTKFTASQSHPLKMYYADFDQNGSTETLLAYARGNRYYPVKGLDELVGQLSMLRKKFPAYKDFAGRSIEEILSREQLNHAQVLEVTTLASGYLLQRDGAFHFREFPSSLQVAPINRFLKTDFDGDGLQEVLAGGNYSGVTPYHGRFDAMAGVIIKKGAEILEGDEIGLNFTQKVVRGLQLLKFNQEEFLIVNFNNDTPEFYKLKKNDQAIP